MFITKTPKGWAVYEVRDDDSKFILRTLDTRDEAETWRAAAHHNPNDRKAR